MQASRTLIAAIAVAGLAGLVGVAGVAGGAGGASAGGDGTNEYVVVYKQGADLSAAHAAVAAAGGKIISENQAIGVATVRTEAADFQDKAAEQGALEGAAVNEAIGQAPADTVRARRDAIEKPAVANQRAGRPPRRRARAPRPRPASRSPTSNGTCGSRAPRWRHRTRWASPP